MNKMKGFYIRNKQLTMLTAAVVIGIFIIFAIIAVIINKGGSTGTDTGGSGNRKAAYNVENTEKITDLEDESDTEIPTIDDGDETESAAAQDETEAETEAETVDPKTLPYKIMVNRAANCITVYENDGNGNFTNPVKAILCSTGKTADDTPLGTFQTKMSYKWLLMVDGSYGQYAYRYYGSILFHSVPYYSQNKGDLEWEQFNKLGEPASLGCVRVCVADAIWLVNNCVEGTLVEVYDDASNPGPLGKPEMIKIPEDSPYRGWDPTDPDKNNPWNSCKPEITVSSTHISVYVHQTQEELIKAIGLKGTDTCGNDVTDTVKIEGADLNRTGTYTVKLSLTDLLGRSAEEVEITVDVIEKETTTAAPVTTEKVTTEKPTETTTVTETTTNETTSAVESTEETTTNEDNTTDVETETTKTDETTGEPSAAGESTENIKISE